MTSPQADSRGSRHVVGPRQVIGPKSGSSPASAVLGVIAAMLAILVLLRPSDQVGEASPTPSPSLARPAPRRPSTRIC